ncbi:MAG: EutN/CcmL family microcompartment protein [Candidatus Coatesbacteria bacterium]|nr:EutN/CcmL family microcompartment protein [Candidatus Coatesbacteria bacterium]
MIIVKIMGPVVSTLKTDSLKGFKLLLVQRLDIELKGEKQALVAVDLVDAGPGDIALFVSGSSARQTTETQNKPVDGLLVGIVEQIEKEHKVIYKRGENE